MAVGAQVGAQPDDLFINELDHDAKSQSVILHHDVSHYSFMAYNNFGYKEYLSD